MNIASSKAGVIPVSDPMLSFKFSMFQALREYKKDVRRHSQVCRENGKEQVKE